MFSCASQSQKKMNESKLLSIELPYIPEKVSPGDKPITLSSDLLKQLLPEINNPRRMEYDDLKSNIDRREFIEYGSTFVLKGDFNNDGIGDIAFTGKYDGSNSFFAIITFKYKMAIRQFYSTSSTEFIALNMVPNFMNNNCAIQLIYKFASDDCEYLHWNDRFYDLKPCQSVWFDEDYEDLIRRTEMNIKKEMEQGNE